MTILTTSINDNGIAIISIDVPDETMNVYNEQVVSEITHICDSIRDNDDIKASIFISAKPDSFIAGADIKMLNAVTTVEDGEKIANVGQALLERIHSSSKPFIAAIDGFCLGAGYELALACHYRIASDSKKTKIGLPEVMLGLLPGGRGTTILSRLVALPIALDMLLTGKQVDTKRARRMGLVDEVVSNKILLSAAEKVALRLVKEGKPEPKPSLKQRALAAPLIRDYVIKKAREQVLHKTKGMYPAPLAILDVVEYGLGQSVEEALKFEAKKFGELTVSPEAKQLINIYFATTELKKETFIDSEIEPKVVNKLGILGGGLMGAGIATTSIEKAGVTVRLKDINDKGIRNTKQYLSNYYQQRIKKRILNQEQATKKLNLFSGSLNYNGFKNCDLIIEAVFEDIGLKHQMLGDIESLGNKKLIFASNTSSIPITDIAKQATRPENVIGMHYFSPVEKMPLLEIIKHRTTSEETLATAVKFGKAQGKTVIVVSDGAGFYVNRILAPYINAALKCGSEGVAFDSIDNSLTKFGFPVGPFKLLDEVGVDVGSKIQPILEEAFGTRMQSNGMQQQLLDKQRLGKKVKKGFYLYDKTAKGKTIDTSIYEDLNIQPTGTLADQDIIERSVYMMLNEAAYCLEDKTISSCRDGDIGAIFGIGFPPFLGGPFRYMDSIGISTVVDKLNKLMQQHGEQYQPAEILKNMAENNKTFY